MTAVSQPALLPSVQQEYVGSVWVKRTHGLVPSHQLPSHRAVCQKPGGGDCGWNVGWAEMEAPEEPRPHWGTLTLGGSFLRVPGSLYVINVTHTGAIVPLKDRAGNRAVSVLPAAQCHACQ